MPKPRSGAAFYSLLSTLNYLRPAAAGVGTQRVRHLDRAVVGVDAVEVQVHDAQAGGGIDNLPAAQGPVLEVAFLIGVEFVPV
jgi:hypothetical protein